MKRNSLHFKLPLIAWICCHFVLCLPAQVPVVKCVNGLSANLMSLQPPQVQLWASDFLESVTPGVNLQLAVREAGTGIGFPLNPDGSPATGIVYSCGETGNHEVELWVKDDQGNNSSCQTNIEITDTWGYCEAPNVDICIHISMENGADIEGVGTEIGIAWSELPMQTDNYGSACYSFYAPLSSLFCVTPTLESDVRNGVNAYDLFLISQYLGGSPTLNSPYKLIAADANKSGTISAFDILELQKLILGIYDWLPNNSSWRFWDPAKLFSPSPFDTIISEHQCYQIVSPGNINLTFTGVKIGDVNNSAQANSGQDFPPPSDSLVGDLTDRTFPPSTYYFDALDKTVVAGEVFNLDITTNPDLLAWQFTLDLPNTEVLAITPGTTLSVNNFGIFPGSVTTAAYGPSDHFSIQLKAITAGKLSDWFHFTDSITTTVGFIENGTPVKTALRFKEETSGINSPSGIPAITLHPNSPNPWSHTTTIPFDLPEATPATLSIMDESGKVILSQHGNYPKGRNSITVDQAQLGSSGVYFYRIETANGMATQKMALRQAQ